MSLDAMRWAWTREIRPTHKLVLLSLADRADERHRCWPSLPRLSRDTGLDPRTVNAALRDMCAGGLVSRTETPGRGYTYRLIGVSGREDAPLKNVPPASGAPGAIDALTPGKNVPPASSVPGTIDVHTPLKNVSLPPALDEGTPPSLDAPRIQKNPKKNRSENPQDFPADGEDAGTGIKASRMEASPMAASPMEASRMAASRMAASRMAASRMEASPMEASPMAASLVEASLVAASPMAASLAEPVPVYALPLRAKSGKEKSFPVTRELFEVWAEAYSLVDVRAELREIKAWLVSNPKKRPAGDMPRFVNAWLSKAQNDNARAAARASPVRESPVIMPKTYAQAQDFEQRQRAARLRQARERKDNGDIPDHQGAFGQAVAALPAGDTRCGPG